MEQQNSTAPNATSTIPLALVDPNNRERDSNDVSSFEIPGFLIFKQAKSQQILSKLKSIEEKTTSEVNTMYTSCGGAEKVPEDFMIELKTVIHGRIKDMRSKSQVDFIPLSDILQNLTKFEESLLNLIKTSFENLAQLEDADENKDSETGLLKKPISKEDIESMDSQKRKKIPYKAVSVLKQWLFDHMQDPYPSNQVKEELAKQTNLNFKQVHNWFINARGRIWKKMVSQERFGNMVEKLYVQTVEKKPK